MQWKLFATFAETAGGREASVDPGEDPTVGDALDALLAAQPALCEAVLDEDGELRDHVSLLLDGEDPFAEGEGLDTPVSEGDELALFPPVSGG
ncbi:MAG: ubiquitin-like small modifier protein 1 [Halorientalis sp.]